MARAPRSAEKGLMRVAMTTARGTKKEIARPIGAAEDVETATGTPFDDRSRAIAPSSVRGPIERPWQLYHAALGKGFLCEVRQVLCQYGLSLRGAGCVLVGDLRINAVTVPRTAGCGC